MAKSSNRPTRSKTSEDDRSTAPPSDTSEPPRGTLKDEEIVVSEGPVRGNDEVRRRSTTAYEQQGGLHEGDRPFFRRYGNTAYGGEQDVQRFGGRREQERSYGGTNYSGAYEPCRSDTDDQRRFGASGAERFYTFDPDHDRTERTYERLREANTTNRFAMSIRDRAEHDRAVIQHDVFAENEERNECRWPA